MKSVSKCLILFSILILSIFEIGFPEPEARPATIINTSKEAERAAQLEKYRKEVSYCESTLGKSFSEIDLSKIGNTEGYEGVVNQITFGLIGFKCLTYKDPYSAVKYFRRDWEVYKKCERKRVQQQSWEGWDKCWPGGPGDYAPLNQLIFELEELQAYGQVLEYYPELYKQELNRLEGISNIQLLKTDYQKYKVEWPVLAKQYQEMMDGWNRAKKLSKTTKPKPIDSDVQNHEWFYSEKREEVLKALEYYHIHNVRFMLKKASKHKDPIIASKAKEYLANSAK